MKAHPLPLLLHNDKSVMGGTHEMNTRAAQYSSLLLRPTCQLITSGY
jgi:hypothetical protein